MKTQILQWKNGKKAAFLLAFDDNTPTHLDNVIPELEKRQIVGTFYINPGKEHFQNRRKEWANAALSPSVELANHTYTHVGATSVAQMEQELKECSNVLCQLNPERNSPRLTAFGRPGGVPWTVSDEEEKQSLQKFNLVKRPRFYGPQVRDRSDAQIAAEMLAVVDRAITEGAMEQLGFHGIGGDWHTTPLGPFIALLDKLLSHCDEIWSTDPASVHKYTTERDAAKLSVLQSSEEEIRLQLSCPTDPFFYDMPLTLGIEVPQRWTNVVVKQGANQYTTIANAGYLQCEVFPISSEIVIGQNSKVL